jgi:hypothetical protein
MNTNIEIKIIDNESYGYLWRVVKESFLAAGKPFFITDPPHPDKIASGWKLDYPWQHINRRIWFRLMQNGWKHRGLIFRAFGCDPWTRFPRPLVITAVLRELEVEDNAYDMDEFTEENGWTEMFIDNILIPDFQPAFPEGKFFILNNSTVHEQTILMNTDGIYDNPATFYQVEYKDKPIGGQFEK